MTKQEEVEEEEQKEEEEEEEEEGMQKNISQMRPERPFASLTGCSPQCLHTLIRSLFMHQSDSPGRRDSLAEWSKALAQGASPQGRGFEPHSCQLKSAL